MAVVEREVGKAQLDRALPTIEAVADVADQDILLTAADKYSVLRRFSPRFLASFHFQSNVAQDPVLAAIEAIKAADQAGAKTFAKRPPAFEEYLAPLGAACSHAAVAPTRRVRWPTNQRPPPLVGPFACQPQRPRRRSTAQGAQTPEQGPRVIAQHGPDRPSDGGTQANTADAFWASRAPLAKASGCLRNRVNPNPRPLNRPEFFRFGVALGQAPATGRRSLRVIPRNFWGTVRMVRIGRHPPKALAL